MRSRTVFLLVLLAALTSNFRSAGAETFRNPVRIPTTSDPAAVLVGDVNNDGVPDILWEDTSAVPFVLHVLLGQHTGGYLPGPDLVLPPNSGGCRLFDSNRDGKLDLVCTSSMTFNASVLILLGDGDATFGAPRSIPLPTSNENYFYPVLSPPFDINGDGLPDLIVSDDINERSYVLLGDSAVGFRVTATLPTSLFPSAVMDVNGDGKPDLLYPEGPSVALGNGDGTFGAYHYFSQTFDDTNLCAFADMDGDGRIDAVCGYEGAIDGDIDGETHLIVLHGNADGTFDPNPISDKVFGDRDTEYDGFGNFQFPLAIHDLNGDGIPDIIAYAGDGFTVLLGGPHLTFSEPKHYAVGSYSSMYNFVADFSDQIVDINGDGVLDVVASGANSIFITYGRPDGTFDTAPSLEVAEVIGYATVADFNGDGIPDLVASGDTSLRLNLGRGDGTFLPFTSIPRGAIDFSTPLSATNAHIAHGDFNGDGKQDILAIGSSGVYQYDSYLFPGHGDGTFDPPRLVPQTSTIFPAYSGLSDDNIADINRDGRSDIFGTNNSVSAGSPNRIDVALSNGDGTFRVVSSPVPTEVESSDYNYTNTSPALADFDGDGKLDAVVGAFKNAYVLRGHGDGSFDPTGTVLPIPPLAVGGQRGATAIAAGDFDGDGHQDLAVLSIFDLQSSAVFVYFGVGDGTFSAPVTAATFNRAYGNVHAADLNQDGRSDLILDQAGPYAFPETYFGIVHALPGRTFGPEVNYTIGSGLSSFAIADMNRDGLPDLVIGNGDFNLRNGAATVLLNLGNTPAVTGTLYATPEPSGVSQSFTLTASLTPPAAATLAGSVTFTVDGAPAGSAALSGNAALISVPGDLLIGSHTLGAVWPGDTTYPAVTLTGRHVVTGLASTTSISAVPNPSPAGGLVTFNIAVVASTGGPAVPTGSVTLTDGQTTLATLPLNAGAVRPFSTTNLSIGSHTITATYGGDSLFASSSASLVEVVKGVATASTLSSAPNPASVGQTVNLSAVVSNAPTTAQTAPSGALLGAFTFTDGASILGQAPIDGAGRATLSVAFSSVGPHSLTAVYAGDATHLTSSATSVEQIIASSVIALSANPNPAYQGANVVFSANVLAQGGPSGGNLSGTVQSPVSAILGGSDGV